MTGHDLSISERMAFILNFGPDEAAHAWPILRQRFISSCESWRSPIQCGEFAALAIIDAVRFHGNEYIRLLDNLARSKPDAITTEMDEAYMVANERRQKIMERLASLSGIRDWDQVTPGVSPADLMEMARILA